MTYPELVSLDVKLKNGPRIYGALRRSKGSKCAAIIMHPSSNFFGHYMMELLPARGITLLALNSRYLNDDAHLIFERVIEDLGAGVGYLRDQGFEKLILLGNSGGASTVAMYQAEAENLTIAMTPAGDTINLSPQNLPPADGIALFGAHPGRAILLSNWLDASLTDESDPLSLDDTLNIFSPTITPPFTAEFISRVRKAQNKRSTMITQRTIKRLKKLRQIVNGPRDEAFIVYRTCADPRFLDLTLDPNDRELGMVWGDPYRINYGTHDVARFTTLTSWMSQWSLKSNAHGPKCIARTSVPVINLEFTADTNATPSDIAMWTKALGSRQKYFRIEGATHFMIGQQHLRLEVADLIAAWAEDL